MSEVALLSQQSGEGENGENGEDRHNGRAIYADAADNVQGLLPILKSIVALEFVDTYVRLVRYHDIRRGKANKQSRDTKRNRG